MEAAWRPLWVLALALPAPAFADLSVQATGTGRYEYNTDVFQVPSSADLPPGTNTSKLGDSYFSEAGKLAAAYVVSNQQFYTTLGGEKVEYDRFTGLNHTDYSLEGGWDWKVASIWDGFLDVTRIRSMVSFYNLIGTNLTLQTEQRETGKVRLQFLPDWRTSLTGMTRKIDQPQAGDSNLGVKESSGRWDLEYLGVAGLTAGVTASYLHGSFTGSPGAFQPTYNQRSGGLTITDDFSGRSTLRGEVGYTKRTSNAGSDEVSGLTGDVDYRIDLTGKTTAEVELSRLINVYLTSTAAEIDNVAALRLNWQATNKIAVNLQYSYTHRDLPGQATIPPGGERTDSMNIGQLTVTYKALSWLALQPYFEYQSLASGTAPNFDFNSKTYGIEVKLQFEKGVIPVRTPVVY